MESDLKKKQHTDRRERHKWDTGAKSNICVITMSEKRESCRAIFGDKRMRIFQIYEISNYKFDKLNEHEA